MEQLPRQLAPFARKIADSKLTHVDVTPIIGKTMRWESKLRGVPYYPKDRPWPSAPLGNPLVLFVQINFTEMPPLDGYPNEGILQLYISAGYDPYKQMWGMRNDASIRRIAIVAPIKATFVRFIFRTCHPISGS